MSKLTWVKWLIYASAAFTLGMLACRVYCLERAGCLDA